MVRNPLNSKPTKDSKCSSALILYVVQHTAVGHDAQGHDGIASDQFVDVSDELTERLQCPQSQQTNRVLVS